MSRSKRSRSTLLSTHKWTSTPATNRTIAPPHAFTRALRTAHRALVLLLLVVCAAGALFAQTPPGASLGFTIVDPRTGDMRPRVSDLPGTSADSLEIGGLTVSLLAIDRVLPLSLDSGYFSGGAPVFHVGSRGGLRRALLRVRGRGEVMDVEIRNIAPRQNYLLYDIPFRPGSWAIDLAPARRDDRGFYRFESVEPHLVSVAESFDESVGK